MVYIWIEGAIIPPKIAHSAEKAVLV